MIDTITEYQFQDKMVGHGFSYDGSKALFNYLEQLEEDCNMKIEFDPIALRCDYTEYDNLKQCLTDYSNLNLKTIEDLRDHTQVIEVDGLDSIIIQAF